MLNGVKWGLDWGSNRLSSEINGCRPHLTYRAHVFCIVLDATLALFSFTVVEHFPVSESILRHSPVVGTLAPVVFSVSALLLSAGLLLLILWQWHVLGDAIYARDVLASTGVFWIYWRFVLLGVLIGLHCALLVYAPGSLWLGLGTVAFSLYCVGALADYVAIWRRR